MELLQIPISHFCEKARWALDYKAVAYRRVNLLPGPHARAVRKLAPESSVPVLVDGERVIQGSGAIIDYLEIQVPGPALTPAASTLATEAREWELYFDQEIGVHLRRFAYHHLLGDSAMFRDLLAQHAPRGFAVYRLALPWVRKAMRRAMRIDADGAERSRRRLETALIRLDEEVSRRPFLVGGAFSRADLAAAALLAPLCRVEGFGIRWPDRFPPGLEALREAHLDRPWFGWVNGLYSRYRPEA